MKDQVCSSFHHSNLVAMLNHNDMVLLGSVIFILTEKLDAWKYDFTCQLKTTF